jgi:crotonobetainyl-CoA:carnitine CoA-transferase CaiB-like acyl-CoA transferase
VTPLPLQGLRVFDLSQGVAAPYCTMLLAAQGADVIKVEPFEGDWIRSGRNQYRGHTAASITVNLGKRSIALDLKHPEGPETARRIAAGCDIVIESFRPGVAARLGLDDAKLRAGRPGLIYASVSGFGQEGPLSRRGVVDQIMQAFCGWMTLNADAAGRPQRTRNVVLADQITGLYTHQAISGALIGKLRHGAGARLDISLMGAMAAFLAPRLIAAGTGGGEAGQVYFAAPTGEYPTRAGVLMLAARKPAEFQRFCEAIGRPDLSVDERFATQEARNRCSAELDREISLSLSARTADEWEALLNERGVMASVVRGVGQFMASEQMQSAGLVETVDVAGVGECPLVRLPGAPAWSARDQAPAVPAIGQHGGDILREAGLAERDIQRLAAGRCVRLPTTEEVPSHVS